MSLKEDRVNLVITINGDQGRKELNELDKSAYQLRDKLKDLKKGTKEYAETQAELKKVEERMQELRNKIGLTGLTTRQLNDELRKLMLVRPHLTPGTQAFNENEAAIRKVKSRLVELNEGIKVTGTVWAKMKDEFRQFGILAASFFGLAFITSQIQGAITKTGKLEDSLADIRNTTGMTAEEVKKLNTELGKIPTRTATTDLRDIAKVAGQFGVAKNEVLDFVKAIDKTAVVLKTEFGGSTEDIASAMAGLRNVLRDIKTDKIDEDIMRIANAEIRLAQAGIATAPVITNFSNRIGGVAGNLGLASGEILGMSATLQELNVNVERGGTAVSRIFQKMTTDTKQFASVAGMPLQDFEKLVNTDIYSAFLKFIDGTRRSGDSATAFANILKDSELAGAGAGEVISKLASNQDLLREKVDLASEALKNTDAITEQYAIKNETLGAKIEKLSKEFYKMATSASVSNFLKGAVDGVTNFIHAIQTLPAWIDRNITLLTALSGAVIFYYAAIIKATATVIANTVAENIKNAAYAIGYRWLVIKEAATKAYALAKGVLTGQITLATAAQRIWNAVIMANPLGAIVIAITALVAGIQLYLKNTKEAIALETDKFNLGKRLIATNDDLNKSYEKFSDQIAIINKLSVQERADLLQKIKLKREETQATLEQMKAQQESIRTRSSEASAWQKLGNFISNMGQPMGLLKTSLDNTNDGFKNGVEAGAKFQQGIDDTAAGINKLTAEEQKLFEIQNAESLAMNMTIQTTENYEEKLRLLRLALNNAALGGKDYLRITQEIRDTQREFDQLKGAGPQTDDQIKAQQQFLEKTRELQRKLRDIKLAMIEDDREKELAVLRAKFEDEAAEIKANADKGLVDKKVSNELLLALQEKFEKDKANLIAKYKADIDQHEYEQSVSNLEKWYAYENTSLLRQLNNQEITRDQFTQRQSEIDNAYLQAKLQNQIDYGKSAIEVEQEIERAKLSVRETSNQDALNEILAQKELEFRLAADNTYDELQAHIALVQEKGRIEAEAYEEGSAQRKLIEQQTLEEIAALNKQYTEQLLSQFEQIYGQVAGIFQGWMQLQNNREDQALLKDKQRNDAKKKGLKKRLDDELISKEDYDEQVAALDEDYRAKQAKIKRQQFERNKQAEIINATISGAVAAVRAYESAGNPYLGAVLAALTALAVGIQIASIQSQPTPEFKFGGMLPVTTKGGVLQGPSHAEGGIDMIDKKTGQRVGNAQGGEPLLSIPTYQNNKPVIDKLLYNSMYRNGAALDYYEVAAMSENRYESGGFLPMLQALPVRDQSNLYQQARYVIEAPTMAEQMNRTADLKIMISGYQSLYREAIQLINEHETGMSSEKSRSFNVEKSIASNELKEIEREIADLEKALAAENESYLKNELAIKQRHAQRLINEKEFENQLEELYDEHYDNVTKNIARGEELINSKAAVEKQLDELQSVGNRIPEKKQKNPGRVDDSGTYDPADPSDQRGLVNNEQNKGSALPDFLTARPPVFDMGRVLETINISRNIVNPFTQQLPNLPLQQIANPNNSTDNTLLITQMIEHLQDVKTAISKLNDNLENPTPQKNYTVLQDFEEVVRQRDTAIKSARISK